MVRHTVLALMLVAAIALAGSITHKFHYTAADVDLGVSNGYTTVNYAGAAHIDYLGMPDLPAMIYHVLIPPTAEVTGFDVTIISEEPLRGEYDVLPVQHPIPWMENPPVQPFVNPDPVYYSVDAPYPKVPAEVGTAGNKSGYRLVDICVYPVRYNPVRRTLSLVKDVSIKLSYETGKRHVARYTEMQNAIHGRHVASLVLNAEDVHRFAPPTRSQSFGSAFLPPGDYEHVILTRPQFADSLKRLADWRTRQGWRSKIVFIDSVCAVYPGRDTAEKMRNFIKDADTTWGTIFVFIARDDYPANQYRIARAYNYDMKCDLYFSDLDGDWDRNANNVFGEIADSVDAYADVFVGMITLNGFTELRNYLNKLFRYEFTPDTMKPWTTYDLLPNGVTFSNNFNDSVANASPSPPWFDCKMYTSGGMVTPTPQRFCDSINSGYAFGSIIAHGAPDLFQLGGDVTTAMMLALTNTNRLNFSTYVCCNTGEWDKGSTNGDCIAENMVFHAPNGFIGVCKNDKSGWVNCAELFNYSIAYGYYGFRTGRRPTMGEILAYGKDYWVFRIKDSAKYRMEMFERNLFGEPAVPVWFGQPFVPQVTFPGAINVGSSIPVHITVQKGFAPVCSALVCLYKGTETFARGWTNASGELTLYVSPLTPGPMQLTVTNANCIPFLDSIQVIAAGKYVTYLRHSISDPPPGGNGDGIINPGETFRIPMWLKNHGTQTAQGVTGRLITHTPGATITDPMKTFGNIPGGDSAQNTQGFEMQVVTGLPNNYAIACSVVCKDNLDTTWVSYVTFKVGAPVLTFVSKQVRDEGSARPNGKLDPGETAELEVTIKNTGLGHGYNVRGVLRSGDARLTVPDSTGTYGTVMVDSTKTNTTDRFTLTAASSIPKGTPISCTLRLYGDGGYASVETFVLVVGEVWRVDPIPDGPRQPPLYWAFDDMDTTYDQRPSYSWVEVNTVGTRLNFSHNDAVIVVTLPTAFGPVKYYGQRYTQISISADGWIVPGSYTTTNFTNTGLPSSSAPPGAICFNWDDLYPGYGSTGYAYYYHDAANHRFIVEFDSAAYYDQTSVRDKFEVIFYDTTLAAPDGNTVFVFQYMTANRYTSNTVGMQDQGQAIAIQALYDGSYNAGCYPLGPGRAIKFTTDEPTGIAETPLSGEVGRRGLAVVPSLFRGAAMVHWNLGRDGDAEVRVFDASGRLVRTLASGPAKAGSYGVVWDGRDERGCRVARGIYFVRLTTSEQTVRVKAILTE